MKRLCAFALLLNCCAVIAEANEANFRSEEIVFRSAGDVSLSGSLTLPNGNGPHPAIVMLGGSERMSRNAIYNWANAERFVAQGIAVFTFDSPGTGKSEGNRWKRTEKERAEDAIAAISAITARGDIKRDSVGLYGASEGGLVVFRVASRPESIAFGIAISAPAVPYFKHIYSHVRTMCAATGLEGMQLEKLVMFNRLAGYVVGGNVLLEPEELKKTVADWNDPSWSQLISLLENRTDDNRTASRESFIAIAQKWEGEEWFRGNKTTRQLLFMLQGFNIFNTGVNVGELDSVRGNLEFDAAMLAKVAESDTPLAMTAVSDVSRNEDPVSFLKAIKCPMLCIYGEKDQEMLAYPGIVSKALADAGHEDFVVKILPGAGHQLTITDDKRTFRHQEVDKLIIDWVQERVRKTQ
jgi:pimeloyl-ACP methyl ester carboxylesterase